MNNISFGVGMIISDTLAKKQYRVLYVTASYAVFCEMNISSLNIFAIEVKTVLNYLIENRFKIEEEQIRIVDESILTDYAKEMYYKRLKIMKDIEELYGPDFMAFSVKGKKEELNEILKKHGIAKNTLWKYIRKYLQSGLKNISLIDQRDATNLSYNYTQKTGRPYEHNINKGILVTDEVKKIFDEGIKIYKSGRMTSFDMAYTEIMAKYYSEPTFINGSPGLKPFADSEKPTYNQFYYYASKQLSQKDMDIIKTSQQEYRNNQRLLKSDSLNGVLGPGDLAEIDEVELDVSLISLLNNRNCVGKPIVYALIDVYSRVILAVSVGFNNNSTNGLRDCLINLSEDKEKYCARFGIELANKEDWPSNIYPKRIRGDRGSEYVSKEAKRIFNDLGITRELVSGGSGSLKGVVEQLFHQFHSAQNPFLEKHGQVSQRYDSHHHKKACLNIDQVTKIIIQQVISHNQTVMSNYPMTKDMIEKGISPSPLNLWNYGCEFYSYPRPILNPVEFAYTLMPDANGAKLSREGIVVGKLRYINSDPELVHEMQKIKKKRIPFKCKRDSRDVDNIYYLRNHILYKATLNKEKTANAEYAGLSQVEFEAYDKARKQIIQEAENHNLKVKIERNAVFKETIKQASEQQNGPVSTTNIKENRKLEAKILDTRNSISNILEHEFDKEPTAPVVQEVMENCIEEVKEVNKKTIQEISAKEAILNFFEQD